MTNPADGLPQRERILLPPVGWRPRPLKASEKVEIIIRQEGKCARTGKKLGTLKETRFDHRPPVAERPFDPVKRDTIPPANDLNFIEAIDRRIHEAIVTPADISRMAKVDHLRSSEDEHQARMAMKAKGIKPPKKGSIRSRGFQNRKRGTA